MRNAGPASGEAETKVLFLLIIKSVCHASVASFRICGFQRPEDTVR